MTETHRCVRRYNCVSGGRNSGVNRMKASRSNFWIVGVGLAGVVVLSIGLLIPLLQPARSGGPPSLTRLSQPARLVQNASRIPAAVAAAARLPRDVDWVIVLEDAEGISQTAVGAALATLFRGSGTDGASFESVWNGLARQLDWEPRETFNRLIGRRVVLVARDIERGETARWALLSQVSLSTDLRLKERLQAAPREIDSGLPILSLENGLYELTSHLNPPDAAAHGQGEVTLIIGPTGRTELFDQMVRSVSRGVPETLADQDVIKVAGSLGDSQILVLHRVAESPRIDPVAPAAAAHEPWKNFIVAGARADMTDQSKLVTRLIYRNVDQREANARISECSSDVFESMKEGSVLTIMQAAPLQQALGSWASIIDAIRDLPVPDRARGFVGQRVAVSLREAVAAGSGPVAGQLAATVALEATSAPELAKSMDGSISRFVRAIEQSGDSDPPPVDFAGELPSLVRVQPVKMSSTSPLRNFVNGPMAMAWSYPTARPELPEPCASVTSDEPPATTPRNAARGWCVVTACPAPVGREELPAAVHRTVAERVTAGHPAAASGRWVWLTWIRPAQLERLLTGNVPLAGLPREVPGSSYRALARATDELDFRLSVTREGDIEGEVTLRLFPPVPEAVDRPVSTPPTPATQP